MTRLTRLACGTIAAAWLGCADPVDSGSAQSAGTPAEGQLLLTLGVGGGDAPPGGVFAAKEAVYLRTQLAVDAPPFAGGDLAFVVVDAQGRPVSTDALACRRFYVEPEQGRITLIRSGVGADNAPCLHGWAVAADGSLRPQLFPFADVAPNADGVMAYTVLVARLDRIVRGAFPEDAIRADFLVRRAAAPPCCQDLSCCGNGRIDPNEQCDDGNTVSGDGCSEVCRIDITP